MLIESSLKKNQPLSEEEIKMIKDAANKPKVFDDDCPKPTITQLQQFKSPKKHKFAK